MFFWTFLAMINYFNPITENGYVYSVDRCRIDFVLSYADVQSFYNSLNKSMHVKTYPENHGMFKYRYLCTFEYETDSVMTIGFWFNGASSNVRTDCYRGFLDFNPNKVANYTLFWQDYAFLRDCCKTFEIVRIDLAVDMPIKRECVLLEKDKRKYRLDMNSKIDKTEYLGSRSTVGFVKLYNKTIESNLDYDLTRLEITINPTVESYFKYLPGIFDISRNNQLDMSILSLNDTDRFIIKAEWQLLMNGLDAGLNDFKSLGRKKYEKLRGFLLPDESRIDISHIAVESVIKSFMDRFA